MNIYCVSGLFVLFSFEFISILVYAFLVNRFTKENQSKRHPMAFLAFATGPRNCVGMRLAKLEAKMALTAILQKFRFVTSPETEVLYKRIQ